MTSAKAAKQWLTTVVLISAVVGVAGCVPLFASLSSMSRAEVQGLWTCTTGGHTVQANLASDGTVTVTGIPVAALQEYDSSDGRADLDWRRLADVTGTWSYFENYADNPSSIYASLVDPATGEEAFTQLELSGPQLLIYYGYVEDGTALSCTKSGNQPAQPDQELLSRDAFVGVWVGGTSPHSTTIQFYADGSVAFTELPAELLRSDGSEQINWDRTVDFTAAWLWAQDPITPYSSITITMAPRPPGSEFDVTGLDVNVDGSEVTLRMRSGADTWDRHINFQRAPS